VDRDYTCSSHFLQSGERSPDNLIVIIFFVLLSLFPVYLSIFCISVLLFSGYVVVENIQKDCINSLSVFSLKYFCFFTQILWAALKEVLQ